LSCGSTVSDLLGGDRHHSLIEGTPQLGENVRTPKGAQHDQYPTNQEVAKLETVPGAQ